MKKPYPIPVFFGRATKEGQCQICFTRDVAEKASPLFKSTSFNMLEKAIVIIDSYTYELLKNEISNCYVFIWRATRRHPEVMPRLDLNNRYVTAEEGGWRKLLFEAMQTAGQNGISNVYVFGESRLVRLVLPYAYDIMVVNINSDPIWDSMKSGSYPIKFTPDFVLAMHPTISNRASYIVGAVEEFRFGRLSPPLDTYTLKEEIE